MARNSSCLNMTNNDGMHTSSGISMGCKWKHCLQAPGQRQAPVSTLACCMESVS